MNEFATLCANYLHQEETLLQAAASIAGNVKEAFAARSTEKLTTSLAGHAEFAQAIAEIQRRRQAFRIELGRLLDMAPADVTLTLAQERMAEPARSAVAAAAVRVRRLAEEVAAANRWVAIHVRIHRDAYRRILRELTGSLSGSGRYGPAGKTESQEYSPLIQVHG